LPGVKAVKRDDLGFCFDRFVERLVVVEPQVIAIPEENSLGSHGGLFELMGFSGILTVCHKPEQVSSGLPWKTEKQN
jgi:hypothetical protein